MKCLLLFFSLSVLGPVFSEFTLTILHTNDFHSRVEQADRYGRLCRMEDSRSGLCFGGASRLFTVIQELRKSEPNVILLDGGDQQTGTIWYKTYRGKMTAGVLHKLGYDAVVLGNHDFDEGADHALNYLHQLQLPVVISNLNASAEQNWTTLPRPFNHSLVLNINGKRVGICGYVVRWVRGFAGMKKLDFLDEVESVRKCAHMLKSKGVELIIALGHAGVKKDEEIARTVDHVDVVIGGHSHTFMYTGTPPSIEEPYSEYPIIVPKKNGQGVAVVAQAYAFGKYLGFLQVTFDDKGKILRWAGNPILLNSKIERNKSLLEYISKHKGKVNQLSQVPVGRSNVLLDGRPSSCWRQECVLGNVITDAFVFHASKKTVSENKWTEVGIALMPAGNIKASIPIGYQVNVTYGDVYNMLPFEDKIDTVSFEGTTLLEALQYSVSKMSPENQYTSNLLIQVSGLHVSYRLDKNGKYEVDRVLAICTKCRIPRYEPLSPSKIYKVLLPRYIAGGGMGFEVFKEKRVDYEAGDTSDVDLVLDYLKHYYPVVQGTEGRIQFNTTMPHKTSGSSVLRGRLDLWHSMIIFLNFFVIKTLGI